MTEHPSHSFLPFMPVMKPDRETTKCRVVFLSNLCENINSQPMTVSHNQAIHAGPSLNQKLATTLVHLRFGAKLLCFDLVKAFNQIDLIDEDRNQLLFLWFRNVDRDDYTVIGYRNLRLTFGLRCSPAILLLGLFKILVLDTEDDPDYLKDLKNLIYQLTYMDNCALSVDDSETLLKYYNELNSIFNPFQFNLQQFMTNDCNLNEQLESKDEVSKLLGILWNRNTDTLYTKPIDLDFNANTKRKVLSSVASQFDIFNYNGPILNRSRVFVHSLQCQKDLDWDDILNSSQIQEWKKTVKQANKFSPHPIERFVGSRDDQYNLIGFSDSSKQLYGTVIYLQNLTTNKVSFILSKSKIVSTELNDKSIPSLEMLGITLATESIIDLYQELSGPTNIKPIKIKDIFIYSDSLVCLSWLISSEEKLSKMQKRSVFVLNRITKIKSLCDIHPVTFRFVSGTENPSDCTTRMISPKQLEKSNFYEGPNFLKDPNDLTLSMDDTMTVTIPNPLIDSRNMNVLISEVEIDYTRLINPHRYSSFRKLTNIYKNVLIFIDKLKSKIKSKHERFSHLDVKPDDFNFYKEASKLVIQNDQRQHFPDVFKYFSSSSRNLKDIPNSVNDLNIYLSKEGILRVQSKFSNKQESKVGRYAFPILLSKESVLTKLIIRDLHEKMFHSGKYPLLAQLRKQFYIPNIFSQVKKVLKKCTICKRNNARNIKLNQNCYRPNRVNPTNIPFRDVYIDYLGPFQVYVGNEKTKVYLLCITCTWSRAVNLKICYDLTTKEFLRTFSMHTFEYGLPQCCTSDLGSQLTSAADILRNFLKDSDTIAYFNEHGIKSFEFDHYFKGCSKLGSLVEIIVKMTKRLIFGAVGNLVVNIRDFEYIITKSVHLINRRPLTLRESLSDCEISVPECITPENLLRGYDLISINIIPELQEVDFTDRDWLPDSSEDTFEKLNKVRNRLIKLYHEEFLINLTKLATNVKGRYKPFHHESIKPGDITLLKEVHTKANNYPLAIVKEVVTNSNGEVTGAILRKGKSREIVKRHSSNIIPYLSVNTDFDIKITDSNPSDVSSSVSNRPKRKAAKISRQKTRAILNSDD